MKKIIAIVVGFILVGVGSFYAGTKIGKGNNSAAMSRAGAFANLTPEQRQARIAQGTDGTSGQRGTRGGGGFASGEVIAKDDKSITVKLPDGGSEIVFFTKTTPVMKSVDGTSDDVSIGAQVTIVGSANQDGSVNAQSIQIRPPLTNQ